MEYCIAWNGVETKTKLRKYLGKGGRGEGSLFLDLCSLREKQKPKLSYSSKDTSLLIKHHRQAILVQRRIWKTRLYLLYSGDQLNYDVVYPLRASARPRALGTQASFNFRPTPLCKPPLSALRPPQSSRVTAKGHYSHTLLRLRLLKEIHLLDSKKNDRLPSNQYLCETQSLSIHIGSGVRKRSGHHPQPSRYIGLGGGDHTR